MSLDVFDQLIRAWEAWDAFPGAARTANTLVDAVEVFTAARGGDPVSLRNAMQTGRREGLAFDVILDKYLEVHAK